MDEKHQEQLNRDVIETIRSGAMKLTGIKRRRFLAEIALKYCNGNPRVTEQKFGFSRAAVETGLGEQRSGLRCVDAFRLRGRKKSEGQSPGLVEEIRQLVEPTAQAAPSFKPFWPTHGSPPRKCAGSCCKSTAFGRTCLVGRRSAQCSTAWAIGCGRPSRPSLKKSAGDRRHLLAGRGGA